MHTMDHAKTSASLWGGKPEDYLAIHDWLDEPKSTFCDYRHRALRHHSFGIYEAEKRFGHDIINSDGKSVHVRYICEQHIKEDCGGIIPTVQDWLKDIPRKQWMAFGYRIRKAKKKESSDVV